MIRARLVAAATFGGLSVATIGSLAWLSMGVLGSVDDPQPTRTEALVNLLAILGLYATPWAVAGAAVGARLARTATLVEGLVLGLAAAAGVTVLGIGVPAAITANRPDITVWVRAGWFLFLALAPFSLVGTYVAWRVLHRRAAARSA